MSKKIILFSTSALLVITPFLFLPVIDKTESFRLPKECFSLFMISVICGIRGVMLAGRVVSEKTAHAVGSFAVLMKRERERERERLLSALLVFCLYIFISSLFSSSTRISLRISFNISLYTLFFLVIVYTSLTGRERGVITNSLVYPGVVMSVYSFFQYSGYDPFFVPTEPYMKKFLVTSGFLDNPNLFAGYLVALIPVALAKALAEKRGVLKLISSLSFFVMVFALFLTNARTGLISFLASLLFFVLISNRWGFKKYVVAGTIIAALFSGAFIFTNKIYMTISRKSMDLPDKSLDIRLIHWKSAWLMISESPRSFFFGKGAGTFKLHYLDYRIEAVKDIKTPVRFENSHYAHNEYIQLWAESGIVSIILAGIVLLFFIKTVRYFYVSGNIGRERHLIVTGYLASSFSVLINSLASFPFHIVPSALAAVTSAALAISELKGTLVIKQAAADSG